MNKKVLIIDDDMDLCLLLGKLLSKNGYETEEGSALNRRVEFVITANETLKAEARKGAGK